MIRLLLILLTLGFSYIPHSSFILKKAADTHGKGTYKILQEVIFQTPEERIVMQETWWVSNGQQLYVENKDNNKSPEGMSEI